MIGRSSYVQWKMAGHTPQKRISALLHKLARFRKDLESCRYEQSAETFFSVMRTLLSDLAKIHDPVITDLLRRDPSFKEYQSFFVSRLNAYYHAIELAEALSLKKKLQSADESILGIFERQFSRNAYLRIQDALEFMDFSKCGTFIMVGCGPLPATLFCIHENTDVRTIIGLDDNDEAICSARNLTENLKFHRVQLQKMNGLDFNYYEADIIYVANLVSPKRKILQQILETAKKEVRIILRDPYGMGILFAESGMEDLDSRFQCMGEGNENTYFLSKHFFLKT